MKSLIRFRRLFFTSVLFLAIFLIQLSTWAAAEPSAMPVLSFRAPALWFQLVLVPDRQGAIVASRFSMDIARTLFNLFVCYVGVSLVDRAVCLLVHRLKVRRRGRQNLPPRPSAAPGHGPAR